jgi:glycosyltransferase involved in cell wall biosynthesis
MKRLLAVSWEMPPMYGPRAAQVAMSLAALGDLGWRSTVVCLDPRRGGPHWRNGSSPEPIASVDLLRVPSPEEWTVLRAAARLAPVLHRLPDSARPWVGRAARTAERAAAITKYDGLITFAQPWSDHLVGRRVHRRTALPWVAHFSDPWVDSPYTIAPPWQMSMWRRIEADVLREASAIVFVSEETSDLVMRKYPADWRRKVSIVPHGFRSALPRAPRAGERRPGPMRIVYTGRFYPGRRTPASLLEAVARLNLDGGLRGTVEIVLVGPHVEEYGRDVRALGIDAIVSCRGRVSADAVSTLAADADVLLVIDAASSGPSVFLPSKLIDYLSYRKPMAGLTPPAGASADLLRRLDSPVAPPDDVEAIAGLLSDLLRSWRAGTLAVSDRFDRVAAEYDIHATTARLDKVLGRAFAPERS